MTCYISESRCSIVIEPEGNINVPAYIHKPAGLYKPAGFYKLAGFYIPADFYKPACFYKIAGFYTPAGLYKPVSDPPRSLELMTLLIFLTASFFYFINLVCVAVSNASEEQEEPYHVSEESAIKTST